MVIFLNAADAGRLGVGDEARVILDAIPDYVIPAEVSFVASDAQFTPKTVETEAEREKLMFRAQLRIDRQVLQRYYGRVETGLRGSGFVRTKPDAKWPAQLEVKLPPEPASPPIAEAPASTPAAQTPRSPRSCARRPDAYASARSCADRADACARSCRHADDHGRARCRGRDARSCADRAGAYASSCPCARHRSARSGANCRGARTFARGGDPVRVHRAGARARVRSREHHAVDWSLGFFRGRLRQTLPTTG